MAVRRTPRPLEPKTFRLDLAQALSAQPSPSGQILQLYIPDRDRLGRKVAGQRKWAREAAELLSRMGGGVTILPPAEGGWWNPDEGRLIWEKTVVVYAYVKDKPFVERLPELKAFVHRFGRQTDQGEVVVEFDGKFYRIVPPYETA